MQTGRLVSIIKAAELEDKYEMVVSKEPDTDKNLASIINHYSTGKNPFSKKCNATAQALLMDILNDPELSAIHSARYRTKSVDSLITKYIRKKSLLSDTPGNDYNIEKYRPMNQTNYYMIITDLIGIRILIRYQRQWEVIHNWIWNKFYKDTHSYIKNWISDYPSGNTEDFLVEKPKLYLRNANDLPVYQTLGKDIFEPHISREGYSSIHYLLWYDQKYVEIQVRTIYDEAWGECTHDLVYKCKNKALRAELEMLSECLAVETQAAGMLSDLMFDKVNPATDIPDIISPIITPDASVTENKFEKIRKRISKMNGSKDLEIPFDGAVDKLI